MHRARFPRFSPSRSAPFKELGRGDDAAHVASACTILFAHYDAVIVRCVRLSFPRGDDETDSRQGADYNAKSPRMDTNTLVTLGHTRLSFATLVRSYTRYTDRNTRSPPSHGSTIDTVRLFFSLLLFPSRGATLILHFIHWMYDCGRSAAHPRHSRIGEERSTVRVLGVLEAAATAAAGDNYDGVAAVCRVARHGRGKYATPTTARSGPISMLRDIRPFVTDFPSEMYRVNDRPSPTFPHIQT